MNSVKHVLNRLLVIPALALLVVSCSKKTVGPDEAVSRLAGEKEPAMLASIQIKSILDKGGLSNFENIPLIARPFIGDRMNMFVKPSATGLDFSKKAYCLMYPAMPTPEIILLANVSDKEKADAYLAEALESDVQENDGYSYILSDGMHAWNDKMFVMAQGIPGDKDAKLKRISEIFKTAAESEAKPKKVYLDVLNDKRDVSFCMSQELFMEMGGQQTNEKARAMMKDCYTLGFASFENGKMSFNVRMEFTENAKSQMNFFSNEGLPQAYSAYMGVEKPWAAMGINMNFSQYYEMVVNFIPEQARQKLQKELGIDISTDPQIKSLLGGFGSHIMISVSAGHPHVTNVTPDEKNFSYKPTIVAAMDLSGELLKGTIDSALTKFRKDGYYELGDEKSEEKLFIIFTKDNVMVASNSWAVLTEIKTKGGLPQHDQPMAKPMFEHPIAGFMDFQSASTELSRYDKSMGGLMNEFESVVMYGSGQEITMEINFTDKSKNGLWTLFHTAKSASTLFMKKRLKL